MLCSPVQMDTVEEKDEEVAPSANTYLKVINCLVTFETINA